MTAARQFILPMAFCLMVASILFLALEPGYVGGVIEEELIAGDKEQHLLAFTGLSVFAIVLWPSASPLLLWTGLFVFGGTIELLQGGMNLGREADWTDLYHDMLATTVTLALVCAARIVAERISLHPREWLGNLIGSRHA